MLVCGSSPIWIHYEAQYQRVAWLVCLLSKCYREKRQWSKRFCVNGFRRIEMPQVFSGSREWILSVYILHPNDNTRVCLTFDNTDNNMKAFYRTIVYDFCRRLIKCKASSSSLQNMIPLRGNSLLQLTRTYWCQWALTIDESVSF